MSDLADLSKAINERCRQRLEAGKLLKGYVNDNLHHAYLNGMHEVLAMVMDAREKEIDETALRQAVEVEVPLIKWPPKSFTETEVDHE